MKKYQSPVLQAVYFDKDDIMVVSNYEEGDDTIFDGSEFINKVNNFAH